MSEDTGSMETPGLQLIVQETAEPYSLADEPVTIGTSVENTVVLTDPEVAAQHATIRRSDEEEGYVIEDAGSPGGTYVNEQRVEGTMALQEGDQIRLGNTILTLQAKGAAEPEAGLESAAEPPVVPPPPLPEPQATTPSSRTPLLIAGGVAIVAIAALACVALFWAIFFGGRDSVGEATSQPPAIVATTTSAPARPTNSPQPGATNTPQPTATDVIPPPRVEYFQASPPSINAGTCTSLQWGQVHEAEEVTIDPGIGGVGTPDSLEVCPTETTEYLLTAKGPGGTTTAKAVVEVIPGLADLTIDSITFDPNPADAEQQCEVAITIRNAGAVDAGSFDWQWQAGLDARFDGRIRGLAAGATTVVVVQWVPKDGYEELSTEAVVDTANEIPEDDKGNNRMTAVIQVIPAASQPETVEVKSEGALDGFRLNDGRGSTSDEILAGNGEIVTPTGELVGRGFMSFDLSDIPQGATIDAVELRFYVSKVTGNPYGKLGNLVVEHVSYGSSLDDAAYNTPAMDSTMLDPQRAASQWFTTSGDKLAAWVQQDVAAGQPRFQLRLRFSVENDGDGQEDSIAIQPGGSALGSGRAPALAITYVP